MTRLVVKGADVFDAVSGEARTAEVAVEDGRIVGVGPNQGGDEVLDAAGSTMLPGLFDCHVHMLVSNIDVWQAAQLPLSYRVLEATRNLAATLGAGITTVRDAAGADLGVKKAVEDGLIPGPRMQIAISMLCQTGGHADYRLPSGTCAGLLPSLPGAPLSVVDGPDQMRQRVRELVRGGADVVKVASSGGVLSPRDDPRHAHFRDAELAVLLEEADAAGLPVMAHALGTEGIKNAVRAGVRSVEHGVYLDDEAVELMIRHGTYLVPTLSAGRSVLRWAESGAAIHEDTLRKQRAASESHARSFQRAVEAGVKVAMGTDAGVTPHGDNLWELELMVEAGMSPVEALLAATRNAAQLLGLADELGTIEVGKRADFVLVDGDPLDVVGLSLRITDIFKDGLRVAGRDRA